MKRTILSYVFTLLIVLISIFLVVYSNVLRKQINEITVQEWRRLTY